MTAAPFAPRFAIVTASDSGIGAATALALADAGMDVGITWHSDQAGAEQTAEGVRARGCRAVVTRFDATELDAVAGVIDDLADDLGGVDVFVNDAGEAGAGTCSTSRWRSGARPWRSISTAPLSACRLPPAGW